MELKPLRIGPLALASLVGVTAISSVHPAYAHPSGFQESYAQSWDGMAKKKDDPLQTIEFSPSVELPQVSLVELIALQGGAGSSGSEDLGVYGAGGASLGPRQFSLRRDLPGLWRMRAKGKNALRDIQIQYRVEAGDGIRGALSVSGSPNDRIAATLLPIAPREIAREGKGVRVYEGGAQLLLDLQRVRKAGRYEGAITIVFNNL